MNETAKKSWFGRHKTLSALLVLGIILAIGSSLSKKEDEEKPVVQVNAIDLYAAYEQNEIAAGEKYKDKILEISGTVDSIGRDLTDSMYVTLETNNLLGSVQCFLKDSETEKASQLQSGQEVILTGEADGMMITNVVIDECTIK